MSITLSQFKSGKIALGDEATEPPVLMRASINDTTGVINSTTTGDDLVLTNKSSLASGAPAGAFMASKVWNAVWNDLADFQQLNDELIFGKCYIDTVEGAQIANERCQLSVIGIASDTFGQALGLNSAHSQVPIAVAGWVLAYVDKEYPCGTPLTNDENGNLTEITLEEKRNYPERIIGIYKKKELDQKFGPKGKQISVDGRHWIKTK